MNGKMYWVLRKTIQNIVFLIKKFIYRLIDNTTGISEYKSFRQMIIKHSSIEILKGILLSVVVLEVDHQLLEKRILSVVDNTIFALFIIACK